MLLSFLKNILSRKPAQRISPPQDFSLTTTLLWQQLDELIRRSHHEKARTLLESTPAKLRNQPEIRLCALRLDLAGEDPTVYQAALRELVTRYPVCIPAWTELGSSALKSDNYAEATRSFEAARALLPPSAALLNNFGLALFRDQKLRESLQVFEEAVAVDGQLAAARMNLAIALLCSGQFERGWLEYEHRPAKDRSAYEQIQLPVWDGQELAGKRLLLVAEQGFGDTILASRFIAALEKRAGEVTLACQKPLESLLQQSRVASSIINMDNLSADSSHFDVKYPLMSVPNVLRLAAENLPYRSRYLCSPPDAVEKWRGLLQSEKRPLVGLVWRGNPAQSNDRNRSIPLAQLKPLLAAAPGTLISLQIDARDDEKQLIAATRSSTYLSAALQDFADTAGLLMHLDMIVSVDTASAHLAGALGQPTLLLRPYVPDWRWEVSDKPSPWYPSVEVFQQQPFGDWTNAITRVVDRLQKSFAELE